MKLLNNAFVGLRQEGWSKREVFLYVLKGIARELNFFSEAAERYYQNHTFLIYVQRISKYFYYKAKELGIVETDIEVEKQLEKKLRWVSHIDGTKYVCVRGINIPQVVICGMFRDHFLYSFLIHYVFKDNYSREICEFIDRETGEGPYGLSFDNFKVAIERGDIVIDAGSFSGDYAAYAANKGAKVYAFEPMSRNYNKYLLETVKLNGDRIIPVNLGLSDHSGEVSLSINDSASSFVLANDKEEYEIISIVALDKFVEDNKIERIDFIKADIEGAERYMLKGATKILRMHAPKLAICTYHLPDDPEVLEKIILEANPNYKIVHMKSKLFATVLP